MTRHVSSESVVTGTTCDRCGAVMRCAVREAIVEDRLRSEIESRCPACGNAWAACSDGPDDYVRAALLATHGPSRLWVADGPADDACLLGLLRRHESAALFEAKSTVAEIRTTGRIGTSVELELLARTLRAAGYAVVLETPGDQADDTA
ncbi:hypothetical protein IU414_13215 [Nocardia farcinica]|uniref:Uncharacterized protein n=1 Tax=Nocardia farcinica TaxID=37329 RepID=A0A0H5NE35_NOCFR|nr:hypothetical protein [Nocardia farcinica]MBF6250370.1 hypothetical protein [Nocardia farcinica]MBF6262229.1 hypothetical protein [Nocardia farcinica]MBF6280768.1 hypothetical protein [Nocardia farcinica]MBF6579736.1 hypothetical protein [Nocardia farcinica]MBF6585713.1 hypothetical protein [Nocardia farcinica]